MAKTNIQLENHEQRIKELESRDSIVAIRVQNIMEVRLPAIEASIQALSVKITFMTGLNIAAIATAVVINNTI